MSATVSHGAVSKRTWTHEGKRRSAWAYTFKVDGRQIRRQGFLSRAEAQEALEAAREQALHPEATAAAPVAMTFGQAVERYLAAKARKRSLAEDARITKHLTAEFGEHTPLAELTAARVATYKAARLAAGGGRLSAAAVNRPLALLRHLLRLACEEWGAIATVPVIRLEREPQGRLRWLTPPEATRLLDACRGQKNARLADLAEFCIYTGLRQGEALGLTWDRVDRARGVVLLELTKSGRRREVPLNGPADAVLARLGGGEGLVFGSRSWDTFRGHWEAAVTAAVLAGVRFHDLRHTFASWAMQRGATLPELQGLLGHSSTAMVLRYAHLAPEHLRSAVARLDNMLAPAAAPSGGGGKIAARRAFDESQGAGTYQENQR